MSLFERDIEYSSNGNWWDHIIDPTNFPKNKGDTWVFSEGSARSFASSAEAPPADGWQASVAPIADSAGLITYVGGANDTLLGTGARKVRAIGISSGGNYSTEVVDMAGAGGVNTSESYRTVLMSIVTEVGSLDTNDGEVTTADAGTAQSYCSILPFAGESHSPVIYCANGYELYIDSATYTGLGVAGVIASVYHKTTKDTSLNETQVVSTGPVTIPIKRWFTAGSLIYGYAYNGSVAANSSGCILKGYLKFIGT